MEYVGALLFAYSSFCAFDVAPCEVRLPVLADSIDQSPGFSEETRLAAKFRRPQKRLAI